MSLCLVSCLIACHLIFLAVIIDVQYAYWPIFANSSPPLEICRWFPQIVFILLNRARPINVGFSNRFFCVSDKRFLNIIIKKKLKKINFKVRFLPLKIAFFGAFENDNFLNSPF